VPGFFSFFLFFSLRNRDRFFVVEVHRRLIGTSTNEKNIDGLLVERSGLVFK